MEEDLPPADEYLIEFNTQIEPGKIVATRVRLDQVTISDMDVVFRVDLAEHPLYKDLQRYIDGNRR